MGYSDIGCYGSEISTPNLDSLANNGVRFSQAYNCARCCPSRASLLTGLYPHQAGIGWMTDDWGHPGYEGSLNEKCMTIAEMLKTAGYKAALSGKWHLSCFDDKDIVVKKASKPSKRGFDSFFGTIKGGGSYFNPRGLELDRKPINLKDEDFYYTDAISDYTVDKIEEYSKDDKPFFVYTSYTAPHWPLHAREEDIEKYESKYLKGWDTLRQNRHEKLKGLNILDPKWKISKRDSLSPPWEDIKHKEWEDRRMSVYAAQIECMDRGIGRIVDKLKELKIYENTIILFLSDNGGCSETIAEDPAKWLLKIADTKTMDGRQVSFGNKPSIIPGPVDTFSSYGLPWANVSNTPFKLYKHWVHEGGISTPLIVSWPEKIKSSNIVHAPLHFIDIMPTLQEISGASYPKEYRGNKITPLEGESFTPALEGKKWNRERPIFWEHEGNRAIRDGQLKLVSKFPGRWELYDMEKDRTELDDLSVRYPGETRRLKRHYDKEAIRTGVLPWPVNRDTKGYCLTHNSNY